MTPERTIEAFDACAAAVSRDGDWNTDPLEMSEQGKGSRAVSVPFWLRMRHLLFMCGKGKEFVRAGRTEKAMRWLGFLQGAIWAFGLASIDEMKHWNMPKE